MRQKEREEFVEDFMKIMGQPIDVDPDPKLLEFRFKLITEEVSELGEEMAAAMTDVNLKGSISQKTKERMLKEMADVQYVLSGLAVTMGFDLATAFRRIHLSNLSKFGSDGKPIYREDGKVLKGPNYVPPDLEDLV